MKSIKLGLVAGAILAIATGAYAGSASHGSSSQKASGSKHAASPAKPAAHGKTHASSKKSNAAHGGSHWGYTGSQGPSHWGSLSRDYHRCKNGSMQSPVNLTNGFGATGVPIEFDYQLTPVNIVHNGHTVQVNYEPGSGISVGGKRYELLQFHFHTPSEHAVDNKQTAMEVHFVHKSADGQLAVVGAMMEVGAENRALREICANMPRKAGPAKTNQQVLINGRDLLPKDQQYFRYMGSLTTPPCSEGVNWFVLAKPITVGTGQIQQFANAVGKNARPQQAMKNRLLMTPAGNRSVRR